MALATPQLPLPLPGAAEAVFAQFVGRANAGSVRTLELIARGELGDWGYVTGPAGSGKTHALLAACKVAGEAGRRAGYVAAEHLSGRGAGALADLDGFDFIGLDDLERLLVAPPWEEAVFHRLNRWRAGGCQVVLAAATPARGLSVTLADLVSRLAAMTEIKLRPLADDGERGELLRRRAAARGFVLDDDVIGYLLRRQGRSPAALVALLDALTEESLAAQRRVTVPFVRSVLERER